MKITIIPGDGVGPEVTNAMMRCVDAVADVNWNVIDAENIDNAVDAIRKTKVGIKGPITTPVGKGFRSVNVFLRKELGLYAGVRPCKIYPGVRTKYKKIDLVVIRENTEDLYSGIEYKNRSKDARILIKFIQKSNGTILRTDTGISIKPISHYATKRITNFAFNYAKKNKRKKITAVHKANIMKYSDGLFLKTAKYVARKYSTDFEDRIVDNMCMQLVQKPEQYDMFLCPNFYGDILSDLCAGLVGGLGVVPGANFGDRYSLFESVHGSALKYAGKNKVNPTAMILSGVMMLRHMKKEKPADKLENAVADVIKEGKKVTHDMGGNSGTKEMAIEIVRKIK